MQFPPRGRIQLGPGTCVELEGLKRRRHWTWHLVDKEVGGWVGWGAGGAATAGRLVERLGPRAPWTCCTGVAVGMPAPSFAPGDPMPGNRATPPPQSPHPTPGTPQGVSLIRLSTEVSGEYHSWIEALERAGCAVKVRGSRRALHGGPCIPAGLTEEQEGSHAAGIQNEPRKDRQPRPRRLLWPLPTTPPTQPPPCPQHLDDTTLSQGSQHTSQQQGGSPTASQLSDSDAATYRRAGSGPFGTPAAQGQEVDSRAGEEVDSGAGPAPPSHRPQQQHSAQAQQGYTSDQSGEAAGRLEGLEGSGAGDRWGGLGCRQLSRQLMHVTTGTQRPAPPLVSLI